MNFFFWGGGVGGEGGVRQSRCIMEICKWHILAFFYPFKELEILDQLILLTVCYC